MKTIIRLPQVMFSLPLVLSLTACGGGGGSNDNNPNNTPPPQSQTPPQSFSGKVADGYIRGATVCLDLNRNKRCDKDEPSSVTGAGGVYELKATAEQFKSPIVAEVPPEAIDEDTNQPIGKAVLLSAPAGRGAFVSPITTLVQDALEADPNLDIDTAEISVKQTLGINGDNDVSLFEDYLDEEAQAGNEVRGDRLKYLHKTARVVTSLMGDINEKMEKAAIDNGLDIASSESDFLALKRLVNSEIKKLLPEIATKVAANIAEAESQSSGGGEFDPTKIIGALAVPKFEGNDFKDKLDNQKTQLNRKAIDAESMLTEGIYEPAVECDMPSPADGDSAIGPQCQGGYTHIALSDDKARLNMQRYTYKEGSWQAKGEESSNENSHYGMVLVNGQWQKRLYDEGPENLLVEALNDKGALLLKDADDGERLRVTGRSLDVAGKPIYAMTPLEMPKPAGDEMPVTPPADASFPEGSVMYHLDVQTLSEEFEFHVQATSFDPSGQDPAGANCENRGGNCNQVFLVEQADNPPSVQTSLDNIITAAVSESGALVTQFAHDNAHNLPLAVKLKGKTDDKGTRGKAVWQFGHLSVPNEVPTAARNLPSKEEIEQLKEKLPALRPTDLPIEMPTKAPLPPKMPSQETPEQPNRPVPSSGAGPSLGQHFASTYWHVKTVQGVKFLMLELPRMVQLHRDAEEKTAYLFFTEHNGYVRRGEWTPAGARESVMAFNSAAIEALKTMMAERANRQAN